jgi:DEAD/DEAH box helicase domain-containing protein
MKFCPKCDSRLISNECNNWKCTEGRVIEKKKPNSSWNYLYAKTKPCFKGCGGKIYFDDDYKSENGKFIPLDVDTREPHQCQLDAYSDYVHVSQKTIPADALEASNHTEIPSLVSIRYFDVDAIPKGIDPIIDEILQGHNEENLGIIHFEHTASAEPQKIPLVSLHDILLPGILDGIAKYGFEDGFLPFQIESIKNILAGKNVIISAPTGSGKTESFVIPIIQKILENYSKGVFVLLTYPLNALVDDQVAKINHILERCGLEDRIAARAIHRGVSQNARQSIIDETGKKCIILATSFDFIDWHLTLQTTSWKILCQPAKVLVMDEAHSYTSFHGSNVYHVIKRMKKYMGDLQFVCSSATLSNPEQFFSEMFDLGTDSFESIKSSTNRKQDIYKFFIMPRKMPQRETMEILALICQRNNSKQLIFSNTVTDAEVLAVNLRERNPDLKVRVHSGVIEKEDRRIAEGEMKQGDLDILSCTPTLELGIDIGKVNVVISAFTGEFDKFVQRIGRAGRRGQKSYAICVFEPKDAVCHYYANHISEYLAQNHTVQINKDNPIISEKHDKSREIENIASCTFDKKPLWDYANSMNLRGTSGNVRIFISGKNPTEKSVPTGYYQLHQKALYRLNSMLYEVEKFEKTKDGGNAYLKNCDIADKNNKTFPIVTTNIKNINKKLERKISIKNNQIILLYGLINLEKNITGYYKGNKNDSICVLKKINGTMHPNWKDLSWNSKHSAIEIHIPPIFYDQNVSKNDALVHTITHIFLNAAKIVAKSDAADIDAHFDQNILYLYDNTANGANGYSKIIYDNFEDVLQKAYVLLNNCDCKNGCPKCIHISGFCHTNNLDLEKQKALEFFKKLL